VHTPTTDLRAVICRLATIETASRTVAPDQVGGAAPQKRLVARIVAVQHTVDSAGQPGS
jgi:hypothetical protein